MIKSYISRIKEQYNSTKSLRADYLEFEVEKVIKRLNKKRFTNYLDIGCGWGEVTNTFSKYSKVSYGVDINENHIIKAKKDHIKNKSIKFFTQSVYNLNFDLSFDLITCFSLLEHLEHLEKALEKISKHQNKGDVFIIQIPNKYFFVELHTYLPFLFLIPLNMRRKLLIKLGYTDDAALASELSIKKLKNKIKKDYNILFVKKMIYPKNIIPKEFRFFYQILFYIRLLNLIPFGYLIAAEKK